MIASIRHARATAPAAPPQDVQVSYNPQDGTVMDAQPIVIHDVTDGPQTDKVKLKEKLTPVNGQYVYDPSDSQYHGAVSFATVNHTVETFSNALGHPVDWAFRGKLGIKPDDGKMLNAFYQRADKSLHFFHDTDTKTGQTVFSADSGEVVSHETGHAILDGLRPAYMESWSPDPAAFHESFGDVMALMVALQDDRVLDKVVQQTAGDLSKPNIASNLGEQLGIAINDDAGKNVTGGDYTRTAINDFTWQDPSTLPDKGDATHLGSEAHSFSRLWTGAIYKVLTGIANDNLKAGQAPKDAIKNADSELLKLYANLFKTAPEGDFTYRDMAKALLAAENQYDGGKHSDLIKQVFTDRGILQAGDTASDTPEKPLFKSVSETTRPVEVRLSGPQFGAFDGAVVDTPVDASDALEKDAEVSLRVRDNLQRLIAGGRIKMTTPDQKLKTSDYFDKNGQPYAGIVRWDDGRMRIERVKIAT